MAAEDDWWQLLTCTHDFEAELSSELSVKAEEQVRIVATGGDGWVVVSNSSGRSGLVPLAYLQRSSEYIKRNGMDEALTRNMIEAARKISTSEPSESSSKAFSLSSDMGMSSSGGMSSAAAPSATSDVRWSTDGPRASRLR